MVEMTPFDWGAVFAMAALLIGAAVTLLKTDWRPRVKLVVGLAWLLFIVGSGGLPILGKWLSVADGPFEWQWAGESWYGTVTVDRNSVGAKTATLLVNQVTKKTSGSYSYGSERVMWSRGEGRLYGNKTGFTLKMPVCQTVEDENGHDDTVCFEMQAKLFPVEAYAGTVTYEGKPESCNTGDMVLVRLADAKEAKPDSRRVHLVRYTSGGRFR